MPGPLVVIGLLALLLSAALLALGLIALRQNRFLAVGVSLAVAAVLLSVGGLCLTVAVGLRGYQPFAPGHSVVRVELVPTGPWTFSATLAFSDGRESTLGMSGDALTLEAHVVRGTVVGRLLGIDDLFELGRVVGRVDTGDEEVLLPVTSFTLRKAKPVDAYDLRQRFSLFGLLFDVQETSATLETGVAGRARYDVQLAHMGLVTTRLDRPDGD